jgi:hypothetical protein
VKKRPPPPSPFSWRALMEGFFFGVVKREESACAGSRGGVRFYSFSDGTALSSPFSVCLCVLVQRARAVACKHGWMERMERQ